MKRIHVYALLAIILFSACSKTDEFPLDADFTATVTGRAPNAVIAISNTTIGATSYKWYFDTGANVESDVKKDPANLTVASAGDFTIVLFATNGSEQMEVRKTVKVVGPAIVAGFTATVTGEAPNAQITISNTSTGATAYEWTFDAGANVATAWGKDPALLTVEKAGSFTIKLKAINGSESGEISKVVTVAGHSPIVAYADVQFGLNAGDPIYGRYFSFTTGRIYKDSEINATTGPSIHLAFASMENVMYYFESPTDPDYNVPGATATKVTNWMSVYPISATDFDSMVDDSKLAGLTIINTNDSFGNSGLSGRIVLFELFSGRKGVIKVKSVSGSRLLVDIKIQKY